MKVTGKLSLTRKVSDSVFQAKAGSGTYRIAHVNARL